jgi:vacuolar-type H+-ATPase subunit I/STV1
MTRKKKNQRTKNWRKISTLDTSSAIIEDALLEDMCEMANEEYEGDATRMNDKGKIKMLKKLSKNHKTEEYFKTENDLAQFMENKLKLPGGLNMAKPEMQRSKISLGIDSRISNHNLNVSLSRLSQQKSRLSNTSYCDEGSLQQGNELKKSQSRTYEMATNIISGKKKKSSVRSMIDIFQNNEPNNKNSLMESNEVQIANLEARTQQLKEARRQMNNNLIPPPI